MMFWGWGSGPMGAAGWAMMVIWALFWIAVVVTVVLVVRHYVVRGDETRPADRTGYEAGPGGQQPGYGGQQQHHLFHRSNALSILEERYARGEIDREEFMRRKADLLQ